SLKECPYALPNSLVDSACGTHTYVHWSNLMNAVLYLQRGIRPELLCHAEQCPRLKWLAENVNHAALVAVIRSIIDDAVFENGIHKGISGNLTQQRVVILRDQFEHYLHTLRLLG